MGTVRFPEEAIFCRYVAIVMAQPPQFFFRLMADNNSVLHSGLIPQLGENSTEITRRFILPFFQNGKIQGVFTRFFLLAHPSLNFAAFVGRQGFNFQYDVSCSHMNRIGRLYERSRACKGLTAHRSFAAAVASRPDLRPKRGTRNRRLDEDFGR